MIKLWSISKVPRLCKTNRSTFNVSQQCSHQSFPACERKHGQAKCASIWVRWSFPSAKHWFSLMRARTHTTGPDSGALMSDDHKPDRGEHFSHFWKHFQLLPPTESWRKTNLSFDNEAASNSCVKHALICQNQTFVALQGLWLRHNTKSSLGWEVVSKINKALKRRNYKHSAMKNEGKPSKQSVACSIFNSFPAWHKDGCQTTEETNGGMTEEWKKMREHWRETIREFSIHRGVRYMQPHTKRYIPYIS